MSPRRRSGGQSGDDLLSIDPAQKIRYGLSASSWPDQQRFPVNHANARVRDVVTTDLLKSDKPLLIAGFSSIARLVDLVATWRQTRGQRPGRIRLLLGAEPFATQRTHFRSAHEEFTEDVRSYWLERSISLRLSAKVIRTLAELETGKLSVRVIPGQPMLHAKIYVGDEAATVGSSNYTEYGLAQQIEANARFEEVAEPDRFRELVVVADNLWSHGLTWDEQFRQLLNELLRVVSWQEALARACAELLEGDWASHLLQQHAQRGQLWPSQHMGIAQALWVVENLGSVLVADATGSGKTRMGAHLVAAVRDRLLDTGRMRRDRDLTTLVCPPALQETWRTEAMISGFTIMPVSHGLLSRHDLNGPRNADGAVARAQVLAVDEAHNFLTANSRRTRQVRDTIADHVLLFTATPISRGAQDLLSLVDLLGADNFADESLEVLERLDRGVRVNEALSEQQRERLRQEIQRFTVRRTKSALNELVSGDEEAYRDEKSGRVCRYPKHEAEVYRTGESSQDEEIAEQIHERAEQLVGIIQLGRHIRVSDLARRDVTDEQWLHGRLLAARGLARHGVLAAMRSSRAALIEHLAGTKSAIDACELSSAVKSQQTGDMINRADGLADAGRPRVELTCELPSWLTDDASWRQTCTAETATYRAILELALRLGDTRERTKAGLLSSLAEQNRLVLAFDHHPITLAAVQSHLIGASARVLIATGANRSSRKQVEQLFSKASAASAIALCSDALNEGLNLQGAAALVHLDLPTTLRVAEQRVGRVDRMDSPHESIRVWWPEDGRAFATRQIEVLLARREASESLLGSNLPMPPSFRGRSPEPVISVQEHIQQMDRPDLTWDGLHDAFDPVRQLVSGDNALLPPAVYAEHRHTRQRVIARVAPVASNSPWAFFALSGTKQGAPRWLLLEGERAEPVAGVHDVAERLRARLSEDPPSIPFDEECEHWLDRFLRAAARSEDMLLPQRMRRALEQMASMTNLWADAANRAGDHIVAEQWRRLHRAAAPSPDDDRQDPYSVGEAWWDLVRPRLGEVHRSRRRRYTRLRDLDPLLRLQPLELSAVQRSLGSVPIVEPIDRRISAAIIGVPTSGSTGN